MSFENLISQYSDAPAYVNNIEMALLLVHIKNGVLKGSDQN